MIKLNSDTFRRAIEKAQTLAPACTLNFTDDNNYTFTVKGAKLYIVDIWFKGGTLWTSCDCAAGVGLHRRGNPMPCYHVAAAALSVGLFAQALPPGAVLDPTPECKAARVQVPPQLTCVRELAVRCDHVFRSGNQCQLDRGHEGRHAWEPESSAAKASPIDISELAHVPAPIAAPGSAPLFAAGVAAFCKAARRLGRVFWFSARSARA